MKGRREGAAFLAWFLKAYYRLEGSEIDDAVCDAPGDKGIDGIYVNEVTREIDVFQARMATAGKTKSLGDHDLKELRGTLDFFASEKSVKHLLDTATSDALKKLIVNQKIAELVQAGYKVRGIFVTTRPRDRHTDDVLKISPQLILYDNSELKSRYLPIGKSEPIKEAATFDISEDGMLDYAIDKGPKMYIAPLKAMDLVQLGGIANQELFAWNLRYRLTRSPVNQQIEKSITDTKEHKYFPVYHNGLTILAEKIEVDSKRKTIKISGYSVVNGCQSLSALHAKSAYLTAELKILTKFILISPKGELAAKITDHTNRQNGITGRDLLSNNEVQMRLQTEIHTKYRGQIHYRIARGEHPEWDGSSVMENDEMARILMAFDLKTPESCHQHYKLFDPQMHAEMFAKPSVNADRIVAMTDINAVIITELKKVKDRAFAAYSLTPYLFLYLLREALELSEGHGQEFIQNPSRYLDGSGAARARLRKAIQPTIACLIKSMEAELTRREQEGSPIDPRRDLKAKGVIQTIRSKVIPLYQMARQMNYILNFEEEWVKAASKK